ncbi:MAG: hypothetical protein JJT78_18125 [Leptospira sp.]|nr:hypothetical protein [Leptospira sp.]
MKKIIITAILILMNCTSVSNKEVSHSDICDRMLNGLSQSELEEIFEEKPKQNSRGNYQSYRINSHKGETVLWEFREILFANSNKFSKKFSQTCGDQYIVAKAEMDVSKKPTSDSVSYDRSVKKQERDFELSELNLPPIYRVTGTIFPNGYSMVTAIPVAGDRTLIYSNAKAKIQVDPKEFIVHQNGGKLFVVDAIFVKDSGGVVYFSRTPSRKYKRDFDIFMKNRQGQ